MPDSTPLSAGAVVELLAVLIPLLKGIISPELSDQIDKAIMKLREEREEKKAKFMKALAEMDIPTLNALAAELMS